MKLDAVAEDRKRRRCDYANEFELPANAKGSKQSDRLLHHFIEIEFLQFERCLFQMAAHSPNDFSNAPIILHDIGYNLIQFGNVGVEGPQNLLVRFRRWPE